jgi:hypothetical protein
MSKRGFDYKKRREWRAWGAKREWPVLNPQPTEDPTILSNVPTDSVEPVQQTWAILGNATGSSSITTATTTFLTQSTFTGFKVIERSSDYPDEAWLSPDDADALFSMPRSGFVIAQVQLGWDGNTTGTRWLELSLAGNSIAVEQPAAEISFSDRQNTVNMMMLDGGGNGFVRVRQDSGGTRTVDIDDLYIAYLPTQGGVWQ